MNNVLKICNFLPIYVGIITILLFNGCFTASIDKNLSLESNPDSLKSNPVIVNDTIINEFEPDKDSTETSTSLSLSPASKLIIRACENYLSINPDNPKSIEVLTIMASLYYNGKIYEKSRTVYQQIISKFPGSPGATDAMKMIAQSFYEEKKYTDAQEWYRKISEVTPDGVNKQEALDRIAESIFRMAELHEESGRFKEAAEQYERVALEFPNSNISDIALFNAGLSYEKQTEWTQAILIFQRLLQKYPDSKLLPKTNFRIARSHEKLMQWEIAAQAYLEVVKRFPKNDLAPTAMYNAGFCFENGNRQQEAAATFEKMAQLFPNSEDAADVLFRASEIYGKIKDWESVGRVNNIFADRYGNDKDRIVQVQCMTGVALYMQNSEQDALVQLQKALTTYSKLIDPSPMNTYYAAKATFTIGEIHHEIMKQVSLSQSRTTYKKQLKDKSNYLELAVKAYANAIQFKIMDWTTRAVFQIGLAYEDFAIGIFQQERPANLSLVDRIELELGIAQAMEQYFVDKALHYHEQNVKLALKESIEDKYVLESRRKLTYLPYAAGENYLSLVTISQNSQSTDKQDGFALIAAKLKLLQRIAPYQERAIDLLLKSLEMGSTYQENDDYFKKSTEAITQISLSVGDTYYDIVTIARDAPIPPSFDDYERFVYTTKLLKQIEGYEDQALTHYLKTLKIADAYSIDDQSVRKAREQIAQTLFNRGRCYDLLCLKVFNQPPYPQKINAAEKEEYNIRFEEIGLKFQDQAFDIYRDVISYANEEYASGPYVKHAYVRLFQFYPDEFGIQVDELKNTAIRPDNQWRCSTDSIGGWNEIAFNDSLWLEAHLTGKLSIDTSNSFPEKTSHSIWYGEGNYNQDSAYSPANHVFFRRVFTTPEMPHDALLYFAGVGISSIYINGQLLTIDSSSVSPIKISTSNMMGKMRSGKNVIAIESHQLQLSDYGIKPLIILTIGSKKSLPQPPGYETPLPPDEVSIDTYQFPQIKNFEFMQTGGIK